MPEVVLTMGTILCQQVNNPSSAVCHQLQEEDLKPKEFNITFNILLEESLNQKLLNTHPKPNRLKTPQGYSLWVQPHPVGRDHQGIQQDPGGRDRQNDKVS